MRKPIRFSLLVVAAGCALMVAAAGCSKSSTGTDTAATGAGGGTTPGGGTVPTASSASVCNDAKGTLNSSGASFPGAFYEEVVGEFNDSGIAPGVKANPYGGGGSGKGKKDLADNLAQWVGSDSTIKDEDKANYKGGAFLYFPTVAAPITASYNLPGVAKLQLSASALAKIFSNKITTWNDPAIAADNPGVTLPSTAITAVHRSDGSGTTSNFTKYLKAAAPDDFAIEPGDQPKWPDGQVAGNQNSGVAQKVKESAGAIGYVDYSDALATSQQMAAVKNKAGKYMAPTLEGASAAVAGAKVKDNLTYDPLNADGAEAYPITAPTYIIVYQNQPADLGTGVKCWLSYVLNEGQGKAAAVKFAALPASLQQKAVAQIGSIKVS